MGVDVSKVIVFVNLDALILSEVEIVVDIVGVVLVDAFVAMGSSRSEI